MNQDDVHPHDMFDDDPSLEAFARDLRQAAAATAVPTVGDELAAVFRDGLPPVDAPAGVRRSRSRRVALRTVLAGVVAGFGIGGLGVAGALPDPMQRQVARVADVVGVQLPVPEEAPIGVELETPPVTTPAPPTTGRIRPSTTDAPLTVTPGTDDAEVEVEDPNQGRGRGRGGDEDDTDVDEDDTEVDGDDDEADEAPDGEDSDDHGDDDDSDEDSDDDASRGRGRSGEDDAEVEVEAEKVDDVDEVDVSREGRRDGDRG